MKSQMVISQGDDSDKVDSLYFKRGKIKHVEDTAKHNEERWQSKMTADEPTINKGPEVVKHNKKEAAKPKCCHEEDEWRDDEEWHEDDGDDGDDEEVYCTWCASSGHMWKDCPGRDPDSDADSTNLSVPLRDWEEVFKKANHNSVT